MGYARSVIIVSNCYEAVRHAIFEELGRGATILEARGGYTAQPRPALYVVIYRSQITRLKRIIADVDPRAFVVVSEAHEVLGEGFRPVQQT